jgi:hypothetical protein
MTTRKHGAAEKNGNKKRALLKKVTVKATKENVSEITQCLVKSARNGDAKSARMLMELADGERDGEVKEVVKERPLLALAAKLAAEPEWPLDAPYEDWGEGDVEETAVECSELLKV